MNEHIEDGVRKGIGGRPAATLTTFGRALRRARDDAGVTLRELGSRMSVSAAYLSAVETGRKPLPPGLPGEAALALGLAPRASADLVRAGDRTSPRVLVGHLAPEGRELVAAFAARIADVPPNLLAELRSVLADA